MGKVSSESLCWRRGEVRWGLWCVLYLSVRGSVKAHPHSLHQQNDWSLHIVSVTTDTPPPPWHFGNSMLACSCSLESNSLPHMSSSQCTGLTTDLIDGVEKQLLLYKVVEWKTAGGRAPADGLTRHVRLSAGIISHSNSVSWSFYKSLLQSLYCC